MEIAFALASALLFAVATVLQQRAASQVPAEKALRLGLMLQLARRPLWLAGIVADGAAFGCQTVAVALGSLIVVQPLLVTGLLFALPIGAFWAGRHLTAHEWTAAVLLAGGLATFLLVSNPTEGIDRPSGEAWVIAGIVIAIAVAVTLLSARRMTGSKRAAMFALATGFIYGFTAALTKATVALFGEGLGHFLTSWEPYVFLVATAFGMLLNQTAFQSGALSASLPTLTVAEPIVASIIGLTMLNERVRTSGIGLVVIAVSIAAMLYGVYALARAASALEVAQPSTSTGSASSA